MTIKTGKTYITRDGQRVRIEAETDYPGTYRMRGEDEQGRITWRARKGQFDRHPSRLDLVAEAEPA